MGKTHTCTELELLANTPGMTWVSLIWPGKKITKLEKPTSMISFPAGSLPILISKNTKSCYGNKTKKCKIMLKSLNEMAIKTKSVGLSKNSPHSSTGDFCILPSPLHRITEVA